MRNLILASAAAFALAVSMAPTFAAQQNGGNGQQGHEVSAASRNNDSSNSESQCANKRANAEQWGATSDELRRCNGGQ
jgi:uncharacterized low-complexity protein